MIGNRSSCPRLLLWILITQVLGTLVAQSAQTPVRDVRVESKGGGVIAGVVETDDSAHKPLRLSQVTIAGPALLTARRVVTGGDGRFEFAGLPPGQYTLEAWRGGYARTLYGARRLGGTGAAIALADGQRIADISMRLARYGVIRGVIYSVDGEPVQGISVEGLRYTMRAGQRLLASVYGQPSFTDDRGVFEIGGLLPGKYYIAAGQSPDRGPSDLQMLTAADVDAALRLLAAPGSTAIDGFKLSNPHQAYAPVYFPGVTDFARAQVIELGPSEERSGVDLRLQLVPTSRVDGTVSGFNGPFASVQVAAMAVTEASSLDLFSAAAVGNAPVDAQGHFTFPALAPGSYVITARAPSMPAAAGGPAAPPLWARTEFSVTGGDQTVSLVLQPCMTISGRVVFAGSTLSPPTSLAGLRIAVPTAITIPNSLFSTPPTAVVAPDGTFTIAGITAGAYRMTAAPPPSAGSWSIRTAVADGKDLLDKTFVVNPGENISDVVVTFTDRPTEVSGVLQTPAGEPTADYFILVFASDKAYWTPSTRRSVSARPATNGRYVVRGLPPGEYFVAASTDVQQGDWWDPEFLTNLSATAQRITLTEGEKKTLDLRIGR